MQARKGFTDIISNMVAKPASHPKSNFTDVQSITLIGNILSGQGRVMPNLNSIDKWPNIDGKVEVQDENEGIVGSIAVQAKTLPNEHGLKFKCPVSFLAYCENIEPCLLFGVDNAKKRVYWRYFDRATLKSVDFRNNKETKTLYFDSSQHFDENETGYIELWTQIIESNKRKLQGFDDLKNEYDRLRERADELLGTEDGQFANMHLFLDELNRNYDRNFPTVKRFFYSNVWKLGMAVEEYKAASLTYALFPISWNKNDVQIKKIDSEFAMQARGFTGHFMENPIEDRPIEYAKEVVQAKVQELVNAKLLDHSGNEILAREIVIAFMDKFYEQMGFSEPSDEYELKFILHGFYNYLPRWIDEAYSFLRKEKRNNIEAQLKRQGYYDPGVIWQLSPEERKTISSKVGKRLAETAPVSVNVASQDFDIGVFLEALKYFQELNKPIKRVYRKPDYDRGGTFIWDWFSEEDVRHNLEIVMNSIEAVYNTVIKNNFPGIQEELAMLGKVNELAVYCKFEKTYSNPRIGPELHAYYIANTDHTPKKTVRIIDAKEAEILELQVRNREARDTSNTKLVAASHGGMDFLYSKTPLMKLVYKILEDRLKDYFNK